MKSTDALPAGLWALLPAHLQALAEPLALAKGQVLFDQGAVPAGLYYVVQGEVVLERTGIQGQTVVLQRVRSGFAAEASLWAARYHCTGRTTLPGSAIRLPLVPLRTALAEDSAFAGRWIGMLNGEVRRLRAQTERLALKGVTARLLHLIETEGSGGALDIGSGLKSLASQLCVTHEALYRTVARLEQAGTVCRVDGCLRLQNPPPAQAALRS